MQKEADNIVYTPPEGSVSSKNIFSKLNPEIAKAITKFGLKEPTQIQILSIDPILNGKNVLLISETGTGKTLAAVLPLFHLILKENPKPICMLYITPMRSLNRDMIEHLIHWGNELNLEISVRHGDTSAYERRMQTEFPPHILITTPETIQAILPGKKIREHLKNVRWVVVDEVHELVDSKRGIQLSLALERVKSLAGHDFQVIGLSATVGMPEHVAKFISPNKPIEILKAKQEKSIEIQVISPKTEVGDKKLAQKLFTSPETAARLRTIKELVENHRSILAFTNTREFAEVLSSRLKNLDKKIPAGIHHSSLSKEVRIKTEKEFKEEKIKAIIATSSLQLGIDIGSIDLILQYMSPRTVTQLIQRVGRSGHDLQKISKGIVIATDEDDVFESAIIARKALHEELEDLDFHEAAYDVLAHQIVGLTLDNWKIEIAKAYDIVRKAYPYQKLTLAEFMEVCKQLSQLGLVFLNGEIKKKYRGFEFYYNQLSTIPDTKQYRVFNTLDNTFVGVLDEEFVALHGETNTTFVIKGQPWRIIQTEEDRVLVEPIEDVEAAIPGWEGELIPVPFAVAQEVGKLRAQIKNKIGSDEKELVGEIQKKYPVDENSARKMISIVKKQKKFGIVPDDKTFLVEDSENVVVIHTCAGTLVNETLGRFLTSLLTARMGSVGLRTDPYRIILTFAQTNLDFLKEILFNTNPEFLQTYLEAGLIHSTLFEWKFIHVAKRFGAISRGAEYGKVRLGRIIDSYAGTPLFKETLKELETEKLDIEKAIEVLKKIQKKEIRLIFTKGLSPLGKLGIKHKFAEVVGPQKPEAEIFNLFKQRLFNTSVRMICINCGKWQRTFVVEEIPKDLRCGSCYAKLLAVVHPKAVQTEKIIKKKLKGSELTVEENARYERARKTADLFIVYGKKTAVALAARGVGPVTARRILAKFYKTDDDFLRDLLESERQFIKTRKFWST
jgi:ATP-dependent Lhr-like helicase